MIFSSNEGIYATEIDKMQFIGEFDELDFLLMRWLDHDFHDWLVIYENHGRIPSFVTKKVIENNPYIILYLILVAASGMMMSSNGNIFHITGPLWGESTSHCWILLTKASDAELWCFVWSAREQTVQQTTETLVIWDAIVLIMTSL